MINPDMQGLLALIKSTREMILDGARQLQVTQKGASDYLTQVDVGVQEYLKTALYNKYPDVQFMGEEQSNGGIDFTRSTWVLDPIDGTANLVHGFKLSAVSLALWTNGTPEFGAVYQPFTDELWHATRGGGCFYNGVPCRVSETADLSKCLAIIGTSPYDKTNASAEFQQFLRIFTACEDVRRTGSAALDLAYVASGRADCFFEPPCLRPWDFGAGTLLVREAGGKIMTDKGVPPDIRENGGILATNGTIHEKIAELL